jgi:hypothetical protein
MADTKLSALTELSAEPADADEVYVNDGGVSKRITYGTLKAALLARANHTGTQLAATISDFEAAVAAGASTTANTAKVTNATHTGDVTGSTALTVDPSAISGKALVTVAATDNLLILDASASPLALKKIVASDFATAAQGATADAALPATGGTMTGNITMAANSPELTVDGRNISVDGAKLDGIAAGAQVGTVTPSSTDTFTNKTFDANGTGNSLSNVDVADLANGTDGQLITWDAAGAPATVATGTAGHALISAGAGAPPTFQEMKPVESIIIAASDETTALTTGTAKVTFRMPYAFTITEVRANVTTAPTGSVLTVDINENSGASPEVVTSILSTKITIDAGERTSETAATAPVVSDSSLADDAEVTIDIDTVGASVAGAGLIVTLIGTRT